MFVPQATVKFSPVKKFATTRNELTSKTFLRRMRSPATEALQKRVLSRAHTRPQEELHQGSKGNLHQYPKESKEDLKASRKELVL
ncbi:Uncharacterized protein FKW44_020103 [Caligus rogercresseyi]|uniref:Uncharacterized protein n=1 Tax=Caligus rogercresseyi TaxID=217165 RepID=A0A7T8GXF2_CALRO|nr:Uncharacterized protein FKW44_020103 [Caligus rogercresseyi]